MTKGKALRFVGGFMLVYGLCTLLSPNGDVRTQMLVVVVGCALSIFGMTAND